MTTLSKLKQAPPVEICTSQIDGCIGSLHFSPHGKLLWIGCEKGRLISFNASTLLIEKEKILSFENNYGDQVTHTISSIAVMPMRSIILAASRVGVAALDFEGNVLFSKSLEGWLYPQVKISPDEKFFAVSDDKSLLIYETDGFRNTCQFKTGESCMALAFSHDNSFLLSAGNEGKHIQKWDYRNGGKVMEFPAHDGIILDLVLSQDDQTLVTSAEDFMIKKWDLTSNEELPIEGFANGKENQMKFTPDFSVLATASLSRVLALRDANTLETIWQHGFANYCIGVDFSRDGQFLAAADDRGVMKMWRLY